MKHLVVYQDPGSFCGWPANNGLWSWEGDEILIGLTRGGYEEKIGHNINEPYRSMLARSLDGGELWSVQTVDFVASEECGLSSDRDIDFTGPGFAMRIVGTGYHGSSRPDGVFYVSMDRGQIWKGPYSFDSLHSAPELEYLEITSRTDYTLVEDPRRCLVMMSARCGGKMRDRLFCVRTTDGGRSFHFVSWIVSPADPYRGVMPATVRCKSGNLVSAVRRRQPGTQNCWIDAYRSNDGAANWRIAAKVGDTGGWNGNPPAMTLLNDGRMGSLLPSTTGRQKKFQISKSQQPSGTRRSAAGSRIQ